MISSQEKLLKGCEITFCESCVFDTFRRQLLPTEAGEQAPSKLANGVEIISKVRNCFKFCDKTELFRANLDSSSSWPPRPGWSRPLQRRPSSSSLVNLIWKSCKNDRLVLMGYFFSPCLLLQPQRLFNHLQPRCGRWETIQDECGQRISPLGRFAKG